MPLRNLILALATVGIVSWYFADKFQSRRVAVAGIVALAILVLAAMSMISSRTRQTRRSFFWGIYDFLTGQGRLPLRLVSSASVFVIGMALLLHLAGVERARTTPTSFIARFVEVDLYIAFLAFLGSTDPGAMESGLHVVMTEIISIGGILFWGMYISILVNKHVAIVNARAEDVDRGRLDPLLYDEAPPPKLSRRKPRKRR